jgi:sugar transferase (PEP-CTERM/EpsH1 system associated)
MESRVAEDQKPALVFICQRLPYAPVTGELITTFNMVRHLAQRYRVFVGTFIDDAADRVHVAEFEKMVCGLHVTARMAPWSWLRALPAWLAGQPVSFALFRSRSLERWLDSVEASHRPVAIITHSSNVSGYAVDRFQRTQNAGPKRVLHFADVDSEKFVAYARRATGVVKWIARAEARRVREEEFRLTARADAVAFVSDEEANLFRALLETLHERVVTLPNGVDTSLFDPARSFEAPFQTKGHAFVFTGAMDYRPNIDAVRWFAREVFPGIKKALPNAQFLIVGSKPGADVRRLGDDPAVVVTGRVESVAAYVAHAQVAVAPLQIARGIQNKVLEAMSMAKPQVVSPGALTGIAAVHGTHLLCAESSQEWVEACVKLSLDPARGTAMGQAARALVIERYGWPAQLEKLDQLLGRL